MVKSLPRSMEKQEVSLELTIGLPKSSTRESTSLNLNIGSSSKSSLEVQNPMMLVAGIAAKEELLKLFRDESFWVKSQLTRRLVLQEKNYEGVFPRVDHFNGVETHVESSKDSEIVKIGATHLVDMFLDSVSIYNINISPQSFLFGSYLLQWIDNSCSIEIIIDTITIDNMSIKNTLTILK